MNNFTLHFVKVFDSGATGVEKLPPEELADERDGRLRVFAFLQDLLQPPVHHPNWNQGITLSISRVACTFYYRLMMIVMSDACTINES